MSIGSSRSTCLLYDICASSSLGGSNPSLSSYIARIRKREAKRPEWAARGEQRSGELRLGRCDRRLADGTGLGNVLVACVCDPRERRHSLAFSEGHDVHTLGEE